MKPQRPPSFPPLPALPGATATPWPPGWSQLLPAADPTIPESDWPVPIAGTPAPAPLTTPASVPTARPGPRATTFYIDADNQPPQCAAALIGFFGRDLGSPALTAVVAGNDTGRQTAPWSAALRTLAPGITVETLEVPTHPDAADLALIMSLGARLERHLADHDLIVICSRDDLLIGAALHARAAGAACVIAHGPNGRPCERLPAVLLPLSDERDVLVCANGPDLTPALAATLAPDAAPPPAPRQTPVPTPLPATAKPTGAVSALGRTATAPPVAPSIANKPVGAPADAAPKQVLVALRARCKAHPKGGYPASAVGQALRDLGYDAKARQTFLTTTAGIRVQGTGAEKRYLF